MTPIREAGRELDAEVAEKVMGVEWRWCFLDGLATRFLTTDARYQLAREAASPRYQRDTPEFAFDTMAIGHNHHDIPAYSSDIAAAFEVVKKLDGEPWGMSFVLGTNACARSQIGAKFYEGWQGLGHSIFDAEEHKGFYAIADSIPLAICKAALEVARTTPETSVSIAPE